MKYAGIGSRSTPSGILCIMEDFAYAVAKDAILRSGGAPGADTSFQFGAELGGGLHEIYLPWNGFNGIVNNATLHEPTQAAMDLAAQFHPGWRYLNPAVRKLIARNGHQILGANLDDPVDMVVCWTPDGATVKTTAKTGGTGQALRIAADYKIPVYNLSLDDHRQDICDVIGDDYMIKDRSQKYRC